MEQDLGNNNHTKAIVETALRVKGLCVNHHARGHTSVILHNISFRLQWGQTAFIVGRSGVGKSLMVRAVLGLLQPDEWELSGAIWMGGRDGKKIQILENGYYRPEMLKLVRGRYMTALFQEPSSHLHPSLTIGCQFNEALKEKPKGERGDFARDLLERVDIRGERILKSFPHQFSQGERQRIAMAMALVSNGLFIADEPTSSVDPELRQEIVTLLSDLRRNGMVKSLVVVTHQQEVIAGLIKPGDIIVKIDAALGSCRARTSQVMVWSGSAGKSLASIHPCFIFKPDAFAVEKEFNIIRKTSAGQSIKQSWTESISYEPKRFPSGSGDVNAECPPSDGDGEVEKFQGPEDFSDGAVTPGLSPNGNALLRVRDLRQSFRPGLFFLPVTILDGVNLEIDRGEIVGVIGPSGSGKSTLAKAIVRLLDNTKGKVYFYPSDRDGPVDLVKIQPSGKSPDKPEMLHIRRFIQYISQEAAMVFNPSLSVKDTLKETLDIVGMGDKTTRKDALCNWLQETGLLKDCEDFDALVLSRFPSELSGGEKQRLNLMRCFMTVPEFVIADEPFASQDLQTASELVAIMRYFQKKIGTAFLLISHNHQLIKEICNRIYLLDKRGCLSPVIGPNQNRKEDII